MVLKGSSERKETIGYDRNEKRRGTESVVLGEANRSDMTKEEASELLPCSAGREEGTSEVWLLQLPPGTSASDFDGARLSVKLDRLTEGKENVGAIENDTMKLVVAQEDERMVQATCFVYPAEEGKAYRTRKVNRRITLLRKESRKSSTKEKKRKEKRKSHDKHSKRTKS